jgi:PilZ domain/Gram-negative bacterial TonB protein C-terminal
MMSTSTDRIEAFDSAAERRFYPRIAPTRPLYVPFGGNNLAMLLNLSENGLLVSTPAGLEPNSVFRLSIRLNGLPKAIEVHVRTIWTSQSKKRAGIQLLDLSDHDREQIRKWGALEAMRGKNEDSAPPADAVRPLAQKTSFSAPAVASVMTENVAQPPVPPGWPGNPEIPTHFPPEAGAPAFQAAPASLDFPASRGAVVAYRRRSSIPGLLAWGAVGAVLCLGTALFLDRGLAEQLLGHPGANSIQTAAPVPPSDSSPVNKVQKTVPSDTHATLAEKLPVRRALPSPENQDDNAVAEAVPPTAQRMRDPVDSTAASTAANHDMSNASDAKPSAISSPAAFTAPSAGTISARGANASKPAAVSATAAPPSVATNTQPSTSSTVAARTPAISTPFSSSTFTAGSSAIAGSIGNSTPSLANTAPHPANFAPVAPSSAPVSSSSSNSTSAWPTSSPPVAAGKSRNSLVHSRPSDASPVVQMDVNPGPTIAITPPRGIGSSFVTIPGERVIDSPGMTVHMRRAVRVPSEHWIWRSRKPLAMGELASRVDPQPEHQPAVGSITVRAMVDKEGRVTDLKPLNGSFSFLPGVARAVREWRYEPTYFDGKPVETRVEIEIDFHMTTAANQP